MMQIRLYSTAEVAELVGLGRSQVTRLAKAGHVGRLVGQAYVFTDTDIGWLKNKRPPRGRRVKERADKKSKYRLE